MTKSTITRELVHWLHDAATEFASTKLKMTMKPDEVLALTGALLASMDTEPVAWTDEQELRDVDRGGCGYLFTVNPVTPHADERRIILLYRHAQPAPVVPAVSDDIGEIRVGRLPTMNQDDYPGLGDWWVQLRIGEDSDEVLARVYGATPQEANNRAEALACRAAMLQAEPVCTCPSGDGSLRWPCPVHPGSSPVIPDGYVMVPMRLTAENGAKGALSGEFSETKFVNCPECFGDDECETCDGSGRIEITVPVTWTTIKEIWAKGVEHFAAALQEVK